MYGLLYKIFGYVCIRITGKEALRAINLLHSEGFRFLGFKPTDGGYFLKCSVFSARELIGRLDDIGAEYFVEKNGGVAFACSRYLRRGGLVLGLALAMVLIFGSTRLIWDVRVECNEEFDEKEVYSALASLGVYSGATLRSVDIYETELTFLMENQGYSDIAINIQGTVASVKLRKRTTAERPDEKTGAYDVVAGEAGVIRSVTALSGEPVVKKGDTVDKGDLLISGTVTGAHGESYLHHAYGSVKATVYRDYTVIIPLKTTEKVYTGNTEEKTSYSVLGAEFNCFLNEKTAFKKAEATVSTRNLSLWGLKLPIVKDKVTYKEYVLETVHLTEAQATVKAEAAFAAFLEREVDGEVVNVSKESYYSSELEAIMFSATAEVVAEIGVETPISIVPDMTKDKTAE